MHDLAPALQHQRFRRIEAFPGFQNVLKRTFALGKTAQPVHFQSADMRGGPERVDIAKAQLSRRFVRERRQLLSFDASQRDHKLDIPAAHGRIGIIVRTRRAAGAGFADAQSADYRIEIRHLFAGPCGHETHAARTGVHAGHHLSVHFARHLHLHDVSVLRMSFRDGHLFRRTTENIPHEKRFLHGIRLRALFLYMHGLQIGQLPVFQHAEFHAEMKIASSDGIFSLIVETGGRNQRFLFQRLLHKAAHQSIRHGLRYLLKKTLLHHFQRRSSGTESGHAERSGKRRGRSLPLRKHFLRRTDKRKTTQSAVFHIQMIFHNKT